MEWGPSPASLGLHLEFLESSEPREKRDLFSHVVPSVRHYFILDHGGDQESQSTMLFYPGADCLSPGRG